MNKLPLKAQGVNAPLFHWTGNLKAILETDILKTGSPTVEIAEKPKKCICLTRMNYMSASDCGGNVRFVVNTDLLKLHGYQIFPTDEIQYSRLKNKKEFMNIGKVMPTKGRWLHHKTDFKGLEDGYCGIEYEYEERVYKEIKNFGKYIIAIQFCKSEYVTFSTYENDILKFLEKYDHIKIEEIDRAELWRKPEEVLIKEKELV